MNSNLDAVKKTLRDEKESGVAIVKSLKIQLLEAEEYVSRVSSAINALEQGPKRKTSRKNSKSVKQSSKLYSTKSEVIAIISGLLSDNRFLTAAELEGLVTEKLVNERNKCLSGFAMRFKEALAAPQFQQPSPGTYQLVESL